MLAAIRLERLYFHDQVARLANANNSFISKVKHLDRSSILKMTLLIGVCLRKAIGCRLVPATSRSGSKIGELLSAWQENKQLSLLNWRTRPVEYQKTANKCFR